MTPATQPESSSSGNHSGQWGLSAILISSLVIILFPIVVMSLFGAMVGANTNDFLESRDIDLGVIATRVMVISLILLANFAMLCGFVGFLSGLIRRQAKGLAVAGLVMSIPALVLSIVLGMIANSCIDWSRGLQKDRFESGKPQHPVPFRVP